VYADHSALALADFVCGANEKDMHLTGVNWGAGCDRRQRCAGICATSSRAIPADRQGAPEIARGIEVGHIFQLGRK